MKNTLQMMINKASFHFHKCFINSSNELILEPKNNIYFRLEDVKTTEDFIYKVLSYCSRPCIKGVSEYWQRYMLCRVNLILDTSFNRKDMELIYSEFGNGCQESLCRDFINNGMSIDWLKEAI